jgi:hypothetical protein
MKNIIVLSVLYGILALTGCSSVYCKNIRYNQLSQVSIASMSKEDFNFYHHHYRRCNKPNCAQQNHIEIIGKRIDEMSDNEYEHFEDLVRECYTSDPRELAQYKLILAKDTAVWSNNEKDFVEGWKSDVASYMRANFPTVEQKRKKTLHIIELAIGVPVIIIAGILLSLYTLKE